MTHYVSEEARLAISAFLPQPAPRDPAPHICGNCRTPTGPSAIPCKNDQNRRPRG